MNQIELFILSEHALTKVFDQITADQWQLDVPKEITPRKPATLKELINYHAYDDAWVPETLAGKTIAEVGKTYDGDLLGGNPKDNWHAIVDKAIEAAKNADLEKTVHLTYGDWPAKEYLSHITMFRTYRAVDFARFLHFDASLPNELVQGVLAYVTANEKMLREYKVIEPAVPVGEDATDYEKMLAITGRAPKI